MRQRLRQLTPVKGTVYCCGYKLQYFPARVRMKNQGLPSLLATVFVRLRKKGTFLLFTSRFDVLRNNIQVYGCTLFFCFINLTFFYYTLYIHIYPLASLSFLFQLSMSMRYHVPLFHVPSFFFLFLSLFLAFSYCLLKGFIVFSFMIYFTVKY